MNQLATALYEVIRQSHPDIANDVLISLKGLVRNGRMYGVEQYLIDAYSENGWSMRGVLSRGKPAPKTIQTYVSTIRKADDLSIDPTGFPTWAQFRKFVEKEGSRKWYTDADDFLKKIDNITTKRNITERLHEVVTREVARIKAERRI